MDNVKDKIRDLLDQLPQESEVLQRVQHLLEYALGDDADYAEDHVFVTYDLETGRPITMREHMDIMDRDEEATERDGTFISLEEARKIADK